MKIDETIKSRFQFLASKIEKINLKNDFVQLPPYVELKLSLDTEYEVQEIWQDEEDYIGTVLLTVKAEAKQNKSTKLSISISIQGAFTDTRNQDEEEFKNKLSVNGCTALYSIARAQIVSLTSQSMNGGQLILPMINVFRLKEEKDKT